MAFDTLGHTGEERSETLHYEPSKLTVIEHIRFKYVAKKYGELTIVTASAQPSPLPKSNASASLLADVLVNTCQSFTVESSGKMRAHSFDLMLSPEGALVS